MDLTPTRTTKSTVVDKLWLASDHGKDTPQTITLDVTNGGFGFTTAGGTIKSGTPVKLHAASKLYRRVGAEEVADGHVYEDVVVKPGTTKVGGSLFWHGLVVAAKVPGTFVAGNQSPHIRYV